MSDQQDSGPQCNGLCIWFENPRQPWSPTVPDLPNKDCPKHGAAQPTPASESPQWEQELDKAYEELRGIRDSQLNAAQRDVLTWIIGKLDNVREAANALTRRNADLEAGLREIEDKAEFYSGGQLGIIARRTLGKELQ